MWRSIFDILVELNFDDNKKMRYEVMNAITEKDFLCPLFDEYICYIDNEDIDSHIQLRLNLILNGLEKPSLGIDVEKYINEVEKIDASNIDNLTFKLYHHFHASSVETAISNAIKHKDAFFEDLVNILKYTKEKDIGSFLLPYLNATVEVVKASCKTTKNFAYALAFFDQLIRYVPSAHRKIISNALTKLCKTLYEELYFDACIDYLEILLNYTEKEDDVYFMMILCRLQCPNYAKLNEIKRCKERIDTFGEWDKLLGTKYERRLYELCNMQKEEETYKNQLLAEKNRLNEQVNSSVNGMVSKANRERKSHKTKLAFKVSLLPLLILAICGGLFFLITLLTSSNHNVATGLARAFFVITAPAAYITIIVLVNKENDFFSDMTGGKKVATIVLPVYVLCCPTAGLIFSVFETMSSSTILYIFAAVLTIVAIFASIITYKKVKNWHEDFLYNMSHGVEHKISEAKKRIKVIEKYFEEEDEYFEYVDKCRRLYREIADGKVKGEDNSNE